MCIEYTLFKYNIKPLTPSYFDCKVSSGKNKRILLCETDTFHTQYVSIYVKIKIKDFEGQSNGF